MTLRVIHRPARLTTPVDDEELADQQVQSASEAAADAGALATSEDVDR